MSKKKQKAKKYSAEFKIRVIMDMREHRLGYRETVRKYWKVEKPKEANYLDILNAGQNEDYRSKFAKALNGDKSFRKTKSGEFMIPVSDIYDKTFEGVNNTIVYAKGTIDKPIITRVLEIDEYDETILSEIRRDLYETERRGVQQKTGGIFRRYTKTDFGDYGDATGNLSKRQGYNNRLDTNRGTRSGEANGTEKQSNVKFNRKEKSVDTKWELSLGHKIKVIANYTRPKVYSEKETRENVIQMVLKNFLIYIYIRIFNYVR